MIIIILKWKPEVRVRKISGKLKIIPLLVVLFHDFILAFVLCFDQHDLVDDETEESVDAEEHEDPRRVAIQPLFENREERIHQRNRYPVYHGRI